MKKQLLSLFTIFTFFYVKSQDSIVLVKSYNNFFYPSQVNNLCPYSSTQLLHAGQSSSFGNNIWQTNGTSATTSTFIATSNPITGYAPTAITMALGKLFFVSAENSNKYLYASDGTVNGTIKLCKLGAGSIGTENMIINPKVANGKLFFAKDSSNVGTELWSTDGTITGTQMVKDIATGVATGLTKAFCAVLNNKFYFVAQNLTDGEELWVTDGTAANTQMVYDLHSGANSSTYFQGNFFTFNNELYFPATVSGYLYGLYKTNGTVGVMPTLLTGGLTLTSNVMVHQNAIYFGAATYTPTIFTTKGDLYSITTASANLIASLTYTTTSDNLNGTQHILGSAGDNLFLSVGTSNLGVELWGYSSITNSVTLLKDIATGTVSGVPTVNFDYDTYFNNKKITIGNKLVFVAQSHSNGITTNSGFNGEHQEEIWVSDGTPSGTLKALTTNTLFPSSDYYHYSMAKFNGDVYFYGGYYSNPSLCKLKLGVVEVDIDENSKQVIDFLLYPNPAQEILNIQFDNNSNNNIKIMITNLLGETVLTETSTNNKVSINTSNLISGVYFVTITNQGLQSTQKIIIQ